MFKYEEKKKQEEQNRGDPCHVHRAQGSQNDIQTGEEATSTLSPGNTVL